MTKGTGRSAVGRGNEARDRKDWAAAAEQYRLHLQKRPADFDIWVQLGHAQKEQGRLVEALMAYSEGLRLSPKDSDLLLNLGHLQKLMGHRDAAVSFYRQSADIDGNADAVRELHALGQNWTTPAALTSIEPAEQSSGQVNFDPAFLPSSVARIIKGARKSARAQGDEARGRGEWTAAAQHYRRHLKASPEDFAIWVQLGHALKESNRPHEAMVAYEEAFQLDQHDADLLLNLGHIHKILDEPAKAASYYQASYERDGNRSARAELDRLLIGAATPRPASVTPIDERRGAALHDIEVRLVERRPNCTLEGPLISILTPVYNVAEVWLRRMVESVQRQTYPRWQLCLVDDGSPSPHVWDLINEIAAGDRRISIARRPANGGISAATNDALALAEGGYVALVDNDDMITCDALEEMVRAIVANDQPDWLYSDECKIDENDRASQLFSKPDWSPFFLLNYMYTGHLSLYKTELVRRLGGFRSQYDFSQDYDLALRVAEIAQNVCHVEKYLYGWRMIEGSGSQGGKPEARNTNIAALQDASDRRGWGGVAVPLPTANRLVREKAGAGTLFSIVVPSDNAVNIATTIRSILEESTYRDLEIVIVTNSRIIAELKPTFAGAPVVWAAYDKPFNFSDKCNAGAALCRGEHIAFFNDDVRVLSQDWVEALLEFLTLPGVGAVGPKLIYENGDIQHAGMVTGVRRLVGTAFHAYPADTSVHFNMAQCVREVSLICGALLAMPTGVFRQIGGFDAEKAPINHSDVDLCFRVREAGYVCVYTPYASLVHIGHMSLAAEDAKDIQQKVHRKNKADPYLLRRFGALIARDPYFPVPMRDLVYIDSQESFACYPAKPTLESQDALLISHDLTGSGAPKVVYDMAIALKRAGRFVVVASPSDGPYREMLQDANITVIIDPLIMYGHEAAVDFAKNFDLVIANTIVGWRAVEALKDFTSVFWYTHETDLVHHFVRTYPDFANLLRSNVTIWSGSARAAEAIGRYGHTPRVVEYGAEDIASADVTRPIRIAVFGSFEPRKGQDLAVLGMALIDAEARKKARLTLFGRTLDASFKSHVTGYASQIKEVEILPELTYQRYREEIAAADIVLVPSRDDTLPLVSLDALALGKALVCTAATGTSAYLKHNESALILEHGDPKEIASELTRLIEDGNLRAHIGRNGRLVFNKWFTYRAFEERLLSALLPAPSLVRESLQ